MLTHIGLTEHYLLMEELEFNDCILTPKQFTFHFLIQIQTIFH